MAKIPWWLWLGVGAVIFIVSSRTGEKMQVFLYIGMFFIIVGVFKMIVAFILGAQKQRARVEAKEIRTHQFTCPRCNSSIASDFGFCPHCGTRLRQ